MVQTVPPARIAITAGAPAGIGPALPLQLAQYPFHAELVAIADPALLRTRAQALGLLLELEDFAPGTPPRSHVSGQLRVLKVPVSVPVQAGHPDLRNARSEEQ